MKSKKNIKIILTGASGFVGSNIARKLNELKYIVTNIDNYSFGNINNVNNLEIKNSDFKHLSESFLNKHDILIHCATSNIIYAMNNPVQTFMNNATDSIKLFEKFKGKIIYTSTASVYGQASVIPTPETAEIKINNAYDQSKYIAELFLQHRGNYTTLRLSNVYGINQRAESQFCGVIGKLIDSIIENREVTINGDGTQTRDYTFINDVVESVIGCIRKQSLNTEVNIATGVETNILQLVDIINKQTNKQANIKHIEERSIDVISRRSLDIKKAQELLQWEPQTSLEYGIKKTVEWMKEEKLIKTYNHETSK